VEVHSPVEDPNDVSEYDAEKHPVWSGNLGDRSPITTPQPTGPSPRVPRHQQRHSSGMSQGGFLAMRCALVHPERVRALILIATQTGTDDPTMLQGYNKMLDAWIANKLPEEIATTLEHVIFSPDWPGSAAWKEKWSAMTAPNLLGAFDTLVRRDDIKVSAIRVPTPIIHGDADAAIPLAKAEAMQASIPNAELVVVEGGHSINMTNPAPVNAAIEAFLARHRLVS